MVFSCSGSVPSHRACLKSLRLELKVLRFQRHYLKKTAAEVDPALVKKCESVLALMNSHLAGGGYFVGGRLSLADVALVAYTRFAHDAGLDLAHWPHVRAWVRQVEEDLKIEHAS